jgi:uncharacterized BrkB/YihY/UPF0761 family membrane protein
MTKKAQISLPIFILFAVLVTGYILSIFSPTINQVRLDQLSATPDADIFEKLILYSLMPLLWGVYVVFSIFAVIWASNSAGQGF